MQLFETVTWPLIAFRSVPCEAQARIDGVDLTGATFFSEVRDSRDGGALRATLNTVTSAASEGIRFVGVETVAGYPVSTLAIRINESTMEAMPVAAEPSKDLPLVWGMHITPATGLKFMAFDGAFLIKAGAPT